MSKNKKSQKPKKNVTEVKTTPDASVVNENVENEVVVAEETKTVEKVQKNEKKDNKKDIKNNKNSKKNSKKDAKEKGKLKRKAKETVSELKKVIWPSFGEVCKKTGVVLVVVLVFAVVVFGIDYCLGLLMGLLK